MSSEIPTVCESQYAAKCFLDAEEVTNTLQLVAEFVRQFGLLSATGCNSLCKASHQGVMMSTVWLRAVLLADTRRTAS